MQRDLDQDMNRRLRAHHASVRRIQVAALAFSALFWGAVFSAAIRGLRHPEAIGAFFGHIASGFGGA